MSFKMRRNSIIGFILFSVIIMGIVISLSFKSNNDAYELLEDSISSKLSAVANSARLLINSEDFNNYNSLGDTNNKKYQDTLFAIRSLTRDSEVRYIYATKMIDEKIYFVFDSDIENNETFGEYKTPGKSHLDAFSGNNSIEFNLNDDYGKFHSASVPIFLDGKVIGVVSADVDDSLFTSSKERTRTNMIMLIISLVVTFAIMGLLLIALLKQLDKAQQTLKRMANYDRLTNLPNRQYLLDYLASKTDKKQSSPFALFFIDLDNFKTVNDNAGHDAGDELLIHIGAFLQDAQSISKVFRPSSGNLNVAARIGGDEFILIVPDITTREDAEKFADELLSNFKEKMIDKSIDKYSVGLSIGVSLYPGDSENYHVLIKYADIAMYHAKHGGKNCFRIYEDEMEPKNEK